MLAAAAVTAAALAGMAALSYVPYAHEDAAGGELRLAWRARSARVEACRRRTAEELERLPAHMRQETVCERGVAPYRLHVALGDSTVVDRLIVAAGARADRPLYVFEELALPPGTYALHVAFTRQGGGAADSAAADPRAAPPRLALDTTVTLAAGRAALVTYDEDARRLHVVTRH
jgi:hypothetical protein